MKLRRLFSFILTLAMVMAFFPAVIADAPTDQELVDAALGALDLPASTVSNLTLPTSFGTGGIFSWQSTHMSVISTNGNVTRPNFGAFTADPEVTLTATATLNAAYGSRAFTVTVPRLEATDAESVEAVKAAIQGITNLAVPQDPELTAGHRAFAAADAAVGALPKLGVSVVLNPIPAQTTPPAGGNNGSFSFTATLEKGAVTATADVTVVITATTGILGAQTINITAPVLGVASQISVVTVQNVTGSVSWINTTDGNMIHLSGAPFQSGKVYRAEVTLTAAAGFQWADPIPAITVPGHTPANIAVTNTGGPRRTLTFTVTFAATATDAAINNVKGRLQWRKSGSAANDANSPSEIWAIRGENADNSGTNSPTNPFVMNGNLSLPSRMRSNQGSTDVFVTWSAAFTNPIGNPSNWQPSVVIGSYSPPPSDARVTLTASFRRDSTSGPVLDTKNFFLLLPGAGDIEIANAIYRWLQWQGTGGQHSIRGAHAQGNIANNNTANRYNITSNLNLPARVPSGTRLNSDGTTAATGSGILIPDDFAIDWTTDRSSGQIGFISSTGVVTFPASGSQNVTLTASVRRGSGNHINNTSGNQEGNRRVFHLNVQPAGADQLAVNTAMNWLTWNQIRRHNDANTAATGPYITMGGLTLPTSYIYKPTNNTADDRTVTITWHTSHSGTVTTAGQVTFPSGLTPASTPASVTLTAVFRSGSITGTETINNVNAKTFLLHVRPPNNAASVRMAGEWLDWDMIRNNNTIQSAVSSNLNLPTSGEYGTTISWASNNTSAISVSGSTGTVHIPVSGSRNATLTATISRNSTASGMGNSSSTTKTFNLTVTAGSTAGWSSQDFETLTQQGSRGFTARPGTGTLAFDAAAAMTLYGFGGDVSVGMEAVNRNQLSGAAFNAVGSRPLYRLTARAGNRNITHFGGTVAIEIPYTPPQAEDRQSLIVYHLNETTGVLTPVRSYYHAATGSIRFATKSFSIYVIGLAAPVVFLDADAIERSWGRGHITFMTARRYFIGNTTPQGQRFDPSGTITRAQFVQVLANYDGVNLSQNRFAGSSFTDVRDGDWFVRAVAWGEETGLFGSLISGSFRPNANITRADMAFWFHNYLVRTDTRVDRGNTAWNFSDISHLSSEYRAAIIALAEAGIIQGIDGVNGGRFGPDRTSQRVEVAAIFERFIRAFTV
jgi:hypothetical protein